jgi:hypothetical protein
MRQREFWRARAAAACVSICVVLVGCGGRTSGVSSERSAAVSSTAPVTNVEPAVQSTVPVSTVAVSATTTTTTFGGVPATTSTLVPGNGGQWRMTFVATYAVEDHRMCNDAKGVDCPASAEVRGEATFGTPSGPEEMYVQDVGMAIQIQTTTYNDGGYACGTITDSAEMAVDVAITVLPDGQWLMWFGGGGYSAGPFIDTVFLGATCETGPQPAVFYFVDLVVPARAGTYDLAVSDFDLGRGDPRGQVTTMDFSPFDGEQRIALTLTLERL